jgi:hypothetical protein
VVYFIYFCSDIGYLISFANFELVCFYFDSAMWSYIICTRDNHPCNWYETYCDFIECRFCLCLFSPLVLRVVYRYLLIFCLYEHCCWWDFGNLYYLYIAIWFCLQFYWLLYAFHYSNDGCMYINKCSFPDELTAWSYMIAFFILFYHFWLKV